MASTKPTVVCIHGGWHTPVHYTLLEKHLQSLGYSTIFPLMPVSTTPSATATVQEDVEHTRSVLTDLISEKKSIIIIMHSYGGIIGTDAVAGLTADPDEPDMGGVIAMIYTCAFIPFENQSLAGIMGGGLPPWQTEDRSTGFAVVTNPGQVFYSDVPTSERKQWTDLLVEYPFQIQFVPVKNAAWRGMSGRVWYLVCEGDEALPAMFQDMMIERVEKEGVKVNVERCQASHSPFISMPEVVGNVVEKAAGAG